MHCRNPIPTLLLSLPTLLLPPCRTTFHPSCVCLRERWQRRVHPHTVTLGCHRCCIHILNIMLLLLLLHLFLRILPAERLFPLPACV
jgi:hypothetical protein